MHTSYYLELIADIILPNSFLSQNNIGRVLKSHFLIFLQKANILCCYTLHKFSVYPSSTLKNT